MRSLCIIPGPTISGRPTLPPLYHFYPDTLPPAVPLLSRHSHQVALGILERRRESRGDDLGCDGHAVGMALSASASGLQCYSQGGQAGLQRTELFAANTGEAAAVAVGSARESVGRSFADYRS